jgi:hypothetical protein
MNSIIEYKIGNRFGNEVYLPTTERGRTLAALAGTKELTRDTVRLAKDLGFTFALQQQVSPL